MKTYKGFDKDLKCLDQQYKVGETYEMDGEIKACKRGFHACEHPFDVFSYYPPASSRFAETESDGKIHSDGSDSKIASSKMTIKAELNLDSFIKLGIEKILSKVDFTNAKESNSGDYGAASTIGEKSIAAGFGYDNKVMGSKGTWIVCAERDEDFNIITILTTEVDGKKIKSDTWYKVVDKKWVEA